MMKKRIAMVLTASMLAVVPASSALAENGTPGMMNEMQAPQGGEMQAPEAPQGGEMQAPEAGGNGQNAPQPRFAGEQNKNVPGFSRGNGQRMGKRGGQDIRSGDFRNPDGQAGPKGTLLFDELLKDGTLSQETYDSIMDYMEKNAPQKPELGTKDGTQTSQAGEDEKSGEAAEKEAGEATEANPEENSETNPQADTTENSEETPETDAAESSDNAEGKLKSDLLTDLLNDGIITQEEYEALSKAEESAKKERAGKASDTQEDAAAHDLTSEGTGI